VLVPRPPSIGLDALPLGLGTTVESLSGLMLVLGATS
jgi:hypothetical protein